MGTSNVSSDTQNNILYLELDGYFTEEETQEALNKFMQGIDELKPGLAIIDDIRNFKPVKQESSSNISKAHKYALEKGLKTIVRVVGQESLHVGEMQMERLARQAGIKALRATSVEEAEKLLKNQ